MTTIPLLQTQDVDVLKCIYFKLVTLLQELDWYGINCDRESYVNDIEKSFIYLQIVDSNCELSTQLECEIKNFITIKSSFCIYTSEKCTPEYTIEIQNNLMTEDNNNLITENSLNIQF